MYAMKKCIEHSRFRTICYCNVCCLNYCSYHKLVVLLVDNNYYNNHYNHIIHSLAGTDWIFAVGVKKVANTVYRLHVFCLNSILLEMERRCHKMEFTIYSFRSLFCVLPLRLVHIIGCTHYFLRANIHESAR